MGIQSVIFASVNGSSECEVGAEDVYCVSGFFLGGGVCEFVLW